MEKHPCFNSFTDQVGATRNHRVSLRPTQSQTQVHFAHLIWLSGTLGRWINPSNNFPGLIGEWLTRWFERPWRAPLPRLKARMQKDNWFRRCCRSSSRKVTYFEFPDTNGLNIGVPPCIDAFQSTPSMHLNQTLLFDTSLVSICYLISLLKHKSDFVEWNDRSFFMDRRRKILY